MNHLKKLAPLIIFVIALLAIQNWWRMELWLNPIDNSALSEQDVVMYATSWCPYCAKARKFLHQAGVPFNEYDIEKSASAHRQYQQLNGRGVPVLKIGDAVIQGYDPDAMRRAIDQLHSQKSPQQAE